RRRHTRWPRDWSSDVCSSDLAEPPRDEKAAADDLRIIVAQLRDGGDVALGHDQDVHRRLRIDVLEGHHVRVLVLDVGGGLAGDRSEERRVGKECRGGWGTMVC